jgi:nucleoside-diphosphate-sugar epimerase
LTIARLGFAYGPGDMHKLALFRAINAGAFIPIGDGSAYLQPIFVEDIASGIAKILDKKPDGTQVFNLCGAQPVTWREFIDAIHAGFGGKTPPIHIPVFVGRCGATLCELAAYILPFKPALTNSRITLMNRSYTYSIEKARRVLAFAPEVGLAEGITRTIAWYRERRLL